MPYDFGFGIRLALALVVLSGTAHVWSADSPTPANSMPTTSSIGNLSGTFDASNSIVPAGYSTVDGWRNTVVDNYEDSSPFRRRRTNPRLGCLHRRKPLQGLDWFHYIRGEGPAIWVHE